MPVVARKPSNDPALVGLGRPDDGPADGDLVDLEAGLGHAAVGLVASPEGVGAGRQRRREVDPARPVLSPVMPAPLPLKPLWSSAAGADRFVTTGVQVAPPSYEASRKA